MTVPRQPVLGRAPHDPRTPVHVTLRAAARLPSLRGGRVFGAVRSALAAASGARFRIFEVSVQKNHLHLLVEAEGATGLARGCQGLAVRLAKAVNRTLCRRGSVWSDRYHARHLATPVEVRRALVYVLQSWKKHVRGARALDPLSSAAWFSSWRAPLAPPPGPAPVSTPRTWLARVGWKRYGPLDRGEGPRWIPDRR